MGQKFLLIYLIVIMKLENQRQFDEIYEYCQLVLDEKLRLLTKSNLYCQTKVSNKEYEITLFKRLSIKTKKKVYYSYICDLDSFPTLKLQMVAAFKPWEEEEINLAKKQAKKVKVSFEVKNGYRVFTEMQA